MPKVVLYGTRTKWAKFGNIFDCKHTVNISSITYRSVVPVLAVNDGGFPMPRKQKHARRVHKTSYLNKKK